MPKTSDREEKKPKFSLETLDNGRLVGVAQKVFSELKKRKIKVKNKSKKISDKISSFVKEGDLNLLMQTFRLMRKSYIGVLNKALYLAAKLNKFKVFDSIFLERKLIKANDAEDQKLLAKVRREAIKHDNGYILYKALWSGTKINITKHKEKAKAHLVKTLSLCIRLNSKHCIELILKKYYSNPDTKLLDHNDIDEIFLLAVSKLSHKTIVEFSKLNIDEKIVKKAKSYIEFLLDSSEKEKQAAVEANRTGRFIEVIKRKIGKQRRMADTLKNFA